VHRTVTGALEEDIIAVMVFTDAPSLAGAGTLVVNDLDLKITQTPLGGTSRNFWGNYFAEDSWYSRQTGALVPALPKDAYNTVIRIPDGVLTGVFSLRVTAAALTGKGVPGLDGGDTDWNQDFALYVYNATQ
jgi:hypothetical protein